MNRLGLSANLMVKVVTVVVIGALCGTSGANADASQVQAGLESFAAQINKYSKYMRLEKVSALPGDKHADVVMAMEDSRPMFILRYDSVAESKPELLVHSMAYLHGLKQTQSSNSYGRMELFYNASQGSKAAQADLLYKKVQLSHKESSLKVAKSFLETTTDNLDSKVEALNANFEAEKAYASALSEIAVKEVRAKDRKLQADRAASKVLDAWEAQELKLNDLVVRNDRAGVAKMLEAYLPWAVMEPFEANVWRQWLEAIRNPDWNKTVVAIRGVDYETDKVQKLKMADGSERLGFFSTVLTKNQGSYTRRLRSLTTNRAPRDMSDTSAAKLLTNQYWNHSADPKASNFISFTLDPQVASGFVGFPKYGKGKVEAGGGILAVRMDSRRLFPNMGSGLTGEIEYLAALIIFPDEVVSYKEVSRHEDSARILETVVDEVKEKTGVLLVENSGSMAEQRFNKAGGEAFKLQMEAPRADVLKCSQVFN
ncbi:MAG: hypothetical protein J7501_17135 [Bdellovibrio sp.]|nr:hypothetical protein [Bdellovibrio sp.]